MRHCSSCACVTRHAAQRCVSFAQLFLHFSSHHSFSLLNNSIQTFFHCWSFFMSRIPSKFVPLNGGGGWGDHNHSLAELRPEDRRRMNIDRDDAEAGSILISLAGHHQEQPPVRKSFTVFGCTDSCDRLSVSVQCRFKAFSVHTKKHCSFPN